MREVEARLRLSAVDRTAKAFSAVQNRLRSVEKQTTAFNRTQAVLGRTQAALYNGMGAAMARFAGPAVVGYAGYKMVQSASNLEDALFGIQKKTGASAKQMATIRDQMQSLAREVPVSMDEIAAAFERGGASGIPLDELRDFAKLSVTVADSWDMSAEDVSNAFAGFTAGMGIAREDLSAFADLINDLADSGIADESGIVDFIDRSGASLKQFGLGKEQIAAYGAALLNLKLPAETAARAMNSLTQKLQAPTNLSPKARKALKSVVGDLGKFSKAVEKDAGGALDDFFAKLEGFSNADRATILGGILGEGFSDEVSRMVGGLGEIRRNLKLAENAASSIGSVDRSMAKKTALFSSQIEILKNNMTELAATLGNPVLREANSVLKDFNAELNLDADARAGVAKEEARGGSEDDAFAEYKRRWEKRNGTSWRGGLDAELQSDFRRDMARYGRGQANTPYAELDTLSVADGLHSTQDRRENDRSSGRRAADAGIPIPTARPMPGDDRREQLALYAAAHTAAVAEMSKVQTYIPAGRDFTADAADQQTSPPLQTPPLMPSTPSFRETENASMSAYLRDQGAIASELEASLTSGGQAAGQSIQEGARSLNEAGGAFASMMSGMGRQFGAEAAAAFNANAKVNVSVSGAPSGASGNKGRTMPDAGGFGGPR